MPRLMKELKPAFQEVSTRSRVGEIQTKQCMDHDECLNSLLNQNFGIIINVISAEGGCALR